MLRHLLSIDDLDPEQVRRILADAEGASNGRQIHVPSFSATLVMLQPSLRTSLGFFEAVGRLGGRAHAVSSLRAVGGSGLSEGMADTLRVASGMTDVVVVRADVQLAEYAGYCVAPLINAGDRHEHPTQALIDLFAIERTSGPIEGLSIGICGDLGMRAVRSLLKLFAWFPPHELRLMAPEQRIGAAGELTSSLGPRVTFAEAGAWQGLDVLYLAGLPEHRGSLALGRETRERYALTGANVHRLEAHARVLSPMPIIDEIEDNLRGDPRVVVHLQSDLGIPVRIAVLRRMLNAREG